MFRKNNNNNIYLLKCLMTTIIIIIMCLKLELIGTDQELSSFSKEIMGCWNMNIK
jgi:hypothetical protein